MPVGWSRRRKEPVVGHGAPCPVRIGEQILHRTLGPPPRGRPARPATARVEHGDAVRGLPVERPPPRTEVHSLGEQGPPLEVLPVDRHHTRTPGPGTGTRTPAHRCPAPAACHSNSAGRASAAASSAAYPTKAAISHTSARTSAPRCKDGQSPGASHTSTSTASPIRSSFSSISCSNPALDPPLNSGPPPAASSTSSRATPTTCCSTDIPMATSRNSSGASCSTRCWMWFSTAVLASPRSGSVTCSEGR